jgi:chromosome condensin MukBEF complex kleisin-like MukF subunit
MQDSEIFDRIHTLVDEEHTLRERLQKGDLTADEEHQRLSSLEEQLDQCWDLLRQRRARRDVGENPDDAASRPTGEVEGYLQ